MPAFFMRGCARARLWLTFRPANSTLTGFSFFLTDAFRLVWPGMMNVLAIYLHNTTTHHRQRCPPRRESVGCGGGRRAPPPVLDKALAVRQVQRTGGLLHAIAHTAQHAPKSC